MWSAYHSRWHNRHLNGPMIRKRLGQAGLGGLPEVRPVCCKSEPSAVWRALFTFPLVPTSPGTCLSRLNGTMSWDGLSRAAWLFAVVEPSQPFLRHILRIGKTPRGPARVYERVLAMTLFSCHLSREAATVQKMVCNSKFHSRTSCVTLVESLILCEFQFPSL